MMDKDTKCIRCGYKYYQHNMFDNRCPLYMRDGMVAYKEGHFFSDKTTSRYEMIENSKKSN